MYIFVFLLLFINHTVFALEDDLQKASSIASHGIKVQAERLKIAAENIANEDSTSFQPGGNPYQRKILFTKNVFDKTLKTNILRVKKIDVDKAPFILKYDPHHPAADLNGYVKYPNIHKEIERADASEAQRSYEANLSIIEQSKSMMQRTIEAIK
ncbi:flagellar basal body rod protein FlgC [Candidatus Trichorickettsia mobilis]|uniref:flagellar basal body rod protein FlgC n=1 Tax=Candidatus Trichorickettsia mobilis TaxID=1346319 RepID=UPI00292FE6A6|nr:flagellar basal body rod protein FlgC [Candidatus Trichorickettsia mobilis]